MEVLELYSGIGGMHLALSASGVEGEIVASIDINNIANTVYKHNFPSTNLLNQNILGLSAQFINKLNVNTIFMSPPCQPFTRNGLRMDTKDARTDSFAHILKILPHLTIKYILIENVKGFESSDMRRILIDTLKSANYEYREFILSPHQFGIPNTRHRYYCLAKKWPEKFSFDAGGIKERINDEINPFPLSEIIESNVDSKYFLSDKVLLKRVSILDVCFNDSTRSCCFTKSYGRFLEGTGSVYCEKTKMEFDEIYKQLTVDVPDKLEILKKLKLRYFTPREVLRLMCFPNNFSFPPNITDKQCYSLLGNSINVKVVCELIKLLDKYILFLMKITLCNINCYLGRFTNYRRNILQIY